MDIGKASVAHVEKHMYEEFSNFFGDKYAKIEPTHILNNVEWYESSDTDYAYPLMIVEPIWDEHPNNLVILCPPFFKKNF